MPNFASPLFSYLPLIEYLQFYFYSSIITYFLHFSQYFLIGHLLIIIIFLKSLSNFSLINVILNSNFDFCAFLLFIHLEDWFMGEMLNYRLLRFQPISNVLNVFPFFIFVIPFPFHIIYYKYWKPFNFNRFFPDLLTYYYLSLYLYKKNSLDIIIPNY